MFGGTLDISKRAIHVRISHTNNSTFKFKITI